MTPTNDFRRPSKPSRRRSQLSLLAVCGWARMHHVGPRSALPTVLLVVAAALLLAGIVMITRFAGFSWDTFVRVGRWALLAYIIAAGMIEFAVRAQ